MPCTVTGSHSAVARPKRHCADEASQVESGEDPVVTMRGECGCVLIVAPVALTKDTEQSQWIHGF